MYLPTSGAGIVVERPAAASAAGSPTPLCSRSRAVGTGPPHRISSRRTRMRRPPSSRSAAARCWADGAPPSAHSISTAFAPVSTLIPSLATLSTRASAARRRPPHMLLSVSPTCRGDALEDGASRPRLPKHRPRAAAASTASSRSTRTKPAGSSASSRVKPSSSQPETNASVIPLCSSGWWAGTPSSRRTSWPARSMSEAAQLRLRSAASASDVRRPQPSGRAVQYSRSSTR
mmetsp:Transcript_72901/g.200076  ORF Transcript_72901/g.200076 Transcript_72901/m.200076 type:complete len:232 (-) Transcript_72901:324-1019(-)